MPDNKLIKSILEAQKAIDISAIEGATRASRSIADLRHSIGKNSALMQAMEGCHARFKLPEIAETARLLATIKSGVLSNIMARYAGEYSSLKRAMESMLTPWLNVQDPLRSMGGFAALQGIGHALKECLLSDMLWVPPCALIWGTGATRSPGRERYLRI